MPAHAHLYYVHVYSCKRQNGIYMLHVRIPSFLSPLVIWSCDLVSLPTALSTEPFSTTSPDLMLPISNFGAFWGDFGDLETDDTSCDGSVPILESELDWDSVFVTGVELVLELTLSEVWERDLARLSLMDSILRVTRCALIRGMAHSMQWAESWGNTFLSKSGAEIILVGHPS